MVHKRYKKIDKQLVMLKKELVKDFPPHHFQHTKVFNSYHELKKNVDKGKVD